MSKEYGILRDGESVDCSKGMIMSCCDCGLVHDMRFFIRGGKIHTILTRKDRNTQQIRRHKKDGLFADGEIYKIISS